MRTHTPRVELAYRHHKPAGFCEKFGGRPWGLPSAKWPRCGDCGNAQSLVAQLAHCPGRLDLGADGRVLYVFHCNHDPGGCQTWEAGSGANALVIVEAHDLVTGPSSTNDEGPEDPEAFVVGWQESDDGIRSDDAAKFFDEESYLSLPSEVRQLADFGTRIGGVPSWQQSASEGPSAPWHFVMQIDSMHRLAWIPQSADEAGCTLCWREPDGRQRLEQPAKRKPGAPRSITIDGATSYAEGFNFGDAGTAYLFLKKTDPMPEGLLFWQCG